MLYGLVNEFRLHALVADELLRDCRSCGRCRFLLASCLHDSEHDTVRLRPLFRRRSGHRPATGRGNPADVAAATGAPPQSAGLLPPPQGLSPKAWGCCELAITRTTVGRHGNEGQ